MASKRLEGDQCIFNSEIRECIIREKSYQNATILNKTKTTKPKKNPKNLKKFYLVTFSQRGLDFVIWNVVESFSVYYLNLHRTIKKQLVCQIYAVFQSSFDMNWGMAMGKWFLLIIPYVSTWCHSAEQQLNNKILFLADLFLHIQLGKKRHF